MGNFDFDVHFRYFEIEYAKERKSNVINSI